MPRRNPTAAGSTDHFPLLASISIAGMSNDQTEAATITPDAKPSSGFCRRGGISSLVSVRVTSCPEESTQASFPTRLTGDRIRKENAAPSIVPNRGINRPMANAIVSKERIGEPYALLNFSLPCLQRGQRQSSGKSSKATPSCSAGSYT